MSSRSPATVPLVDMNALWRERVTPLDQLQPRRVYYVRARNLQVAAFEPDQSAFIGIREKFDARYLFAEAARDHEGPSWGTAWTQGVTPYTVPQDVRLAERSPELFALLDGLPVGPLDFIPDVAAYGPSGDRAHFPVEQWRGDVQLAACGQKLHRYDWQQGDHFARYLVETDRVCARCRRIRGAG